MKANHVKSKPALTTTQISKKLGFTISVSFIEDTLGINADEKTHNCTLWEQDKFNYICARLSEYVLSIRD